MLILKLVQQLQQRLDRSATEQLTYQQLRHLDPHLLQDIGLQIEGHRVVPLSPLAPTAIPSSALAEETTTAYASKDAAKPRLEPLGSGG